MRHDGSTAARAAVSAVFFVNGALLANWVPRIPDVKADLGLSDGALGLALLGIGAGALCGSVVAGPLDTRFGSRTMSTVGGMLLAAVLFLPGLAASWGALTAMLLLLGAGDAVMDVSMNSHAVLVQRRYGRSILNAFHGLWSIGAVAGSLAGAFAAARQVPVAVHLLLAGTVGAAVVALARRWLLEPPAAAPASGARRRDRVRARGWAAPTGALGALGVVAFLGGVVEDAPASWSAVYLREALGASPGVAGLAFAAFTAAMTVGRIAGDRATERFGAVLVLRGGTLLGACGLAAGLVIATPVAAIAGFALTGLGVSTLFPLVFAAAGGLPGIPSGGGIATVSLIARGGFLAGPPVIGLLADAAGLRLALGVVVVACVAIASFAGALTRQAVAAA